MKKHLQELTASLSNAVSNCISGEKAIAILFSGGLDSSLLAWLAKKHAEITLYTAGTSNSHDLTHAEQAAKLMDINLKCIKITEADIISAIPKLVDIIDTHHPVKISFELPLFLAIANIEEKLILSGQGADELFGGYARYLKMRKDELQTALAKDLKMLISEDIKMDLQIAKHFKKDLKTPYLHEDVVRCAGNIPIEYKVNENQRKIILKETALNLGLPRNIANKEKKAVQYSSGIIKELRKMAKS